LRNPYKEIATGYVFLLCYGLERHLLLGDFERAFDVVLKLRQAHKNNSFLSYSSTALVLSCLQHKNPEYLGKYLLSLDDAQISTINVSLFLLCLHSFGLDLTPKHIMLFAKKFAFENNRYIKKCPDIFLAELEKAIEKQTKQTTINLHNIVKNIHNVKKSDFMPFANVSLRNDKNAISVPDLTTDIKLTTLCNNLLNIAHEETKAHMKSLPKKEKTTQTKAPKAETETIVDDSLISDELKNTETTLIKEEISAKRDAIKLHYCYLSIINFAYKNRKHEYYLRMCMDYCKKDINIYPKFRDKYLLGLKREMDSSLDFKGSERYQELRKQNIERIEMMISGNRVDIGIPSFERLAIIFEKQGNIKEAIEVCELALSYNIQGTFDKRLDKLMKKLK